MCICTLFNHFFMLKISFSRIYNNLKFGSEMKTIPEQSTTLIHEDRAFRLRLDKGAFCFFILGMFLSAMIFHSIGIFPAS